MNPYVTGPTLIREPCDDQKPHVQHLYPEAKTHLCDGRGPIDDAMARHRREHS